MKLRATFSLLFVCLAGTSFAAPITRSQALSKAQQFFAQHGMTVETRREPMRAPSAKLDDSPYYIYSATGGKGFAIVSGDDRTTPILGYSLTGKISYDEAPANLKWWLDEYQRQIEWLQSHGKQAAKQAAPDTRAVIAPLLTTKWDQGEPYNNTCPDFFTYGKSATGCVATAMAQVLYYQWQHYPDRMPTQTAAEIAGYTCNTNWNSLGRISVSAIPAGSKIDWANMLLDYPYNGYTSAQATAVANLMKYCGAAVQMEYANSGNGGSAGNAYRVPGAFKNYFGIDPSCANSSRLDYRTAKAWNDMIYNELANKRVVLYQGISAEGSGHCFVIDGYDGNSFFNVNWGWNGIGDGAYVLSALSPEGTGTGAGTVDDGYNYHQAVVINVEPDHGGEADEGKLTAENFTITRRVLSYQPQNIGSTTQSYNWGYGELKDDGTITPIGTPTTYNVQFPVGSYLQQPTTINLNNQRLSEGEHHIVPIYRVRGTQTWKSMWDPTSWVKVTVSGSTVTINDAPAADLKISNLKISDNLTANLPATITFDAINTGDDDYSGFTYLFASQTDEKGDYVTHPTVGVVAGGEANQTASWTPTAPGTYNLWLCADTLGNDVLATATGIVVGKGRTIGTDFSLMNMAVGNADDQTYVSDDNRLVTVVSRTNTLAGSWTVRANEAQSTEQQVMTFIYRKNERTGNFTNVTAQYSTNGLGYYVVNFGKGTSVNGSFSFSGLTDGTYVIRPEVGRVSWTQEGLRMNPEVWFDDTRAFEVTYATGINAVSDDAATNGETGDQTIRTLQGVTVAKGGDINAALKRLPRGVYIVGGKKVTVK